MVNVPRLLGGKEKIYFFGLCQEIAKEKKVCLGGKPAWPLLRLYLHFLFKNDRLLFSGEGLNRLSQEAEDSVPVLDQDPTPEAKLQNLEWFSNLNSTALFFRDKEGSVFLKQASRYVDKFLDPVIDLLPAGSRYLKLDLTGRLPNNLVVPANDSGLKVFHRPCSPPVLSGDIEGLDEINRLMTSFGGGQYFDVGLFAKSLNNRAQQYPFFFSLLSSVSPSVIFTRCYYSPVWQSMRLAALDLGIRTVDIQHGLTGPFHPAYGHWCPTLAHSVNIMPDEIWVWDDRWGNFIRDSELNKLRKTNVVATGNLWVAYQKKFDWGKPLEALVELKRTHEQIVLIVLGYATSKFPAYVVRALLRLLEEHPKTAFLVRAHPHEDDGYSKTFLTQIRQPESKNLVADLANALPLEVLLAATDTVLSNGSTVDCEALELGCRVVTTDLTSSPLRDESQRSDHLFWARSEEDLVECLTLRPGKL